MSTPKKYIIEHMESEFSEWVRLEYLAIQKDVGLENFYLSSLPAGTTDADIPKSLIDNKIQWTTCEVTKFAEKYPGFDYSRVCLLDPSADQDICPEDTDKFDFFLFGGILGDHPPRDRTGELRKYGFPGRRLGKMQMTTDTAVRVTQLVVEGQNKLDGINYIDYPEFRFNKMESTEMPFRYVLDAEGKPILPEGMLDLIKHDSEKSLDDML
ncbi:DUF431-domain-containing protein [Nadsonia fulvescens var. elongata DSM 6958]|uniref:DUF431-domain-containing protein n=1 Tax=Nadsonia fulvescens var. elongata DSM 6958 TaxID=857566 RepID=A0A1E3PF20_9ASCO|nr:DUF431-domain-containing protein [Nadsonia fulvescens var. elongata DSM 6958]